MWPSYHVQYLEDICTEHGIKEGVHGNSVCRQGMSRYHFPFGILELILKTFHFNQYPEKKK